MSSPPGFKFTGEKGGVGLSNPSNKSEKVGIKEKCYPSVVLVVTRNPFHYRLFTDHGPGLLVEQPNGS